MCEMIDEVLSNDTLFAVTPNHQPHDCLVSRLFSRRSKKTSKLRVIGLCAGNSPVVGEFPVQMANNAENVSIWCPADFVYL